MTTFDIKDGIVLDYTLDGWAEYKKWLDGTYAKLFYAWTDEGAAYSLVAVDGKVYRTFSMNKVDATEFEAEFKLEGLTQPIDAKSQNGYLVVSSHPAESSKLTFYTPNWCDPTTWYYSSTRQVDVGMTDSGDHILYNIPSWSASKHVVDLGHGKITNEHLLVDSDANSYRVEVKVDGNVQTEQDPHFGTGGDYTVDYNAGSISFLSALTGTEAVTMTYHLVDRTAADGSASCWVLKPEATKLLEIVKVEVQLSENVDLKDSVSFQAFVDPPGVPASTEDLYHTMLDFYNDANGSHPKLPALGGTSWRGCPEPVYSLPWQYQAVTKLPASQNAEVRICLKHDEPFASTNANPGLATATFYCLTVPEE